MLRKKTLAFALVLFFASLQAYDKNSWGMGDAAGIPSGAAQAAAVLQENRAGSLLAAQQEIAAFLSSKKSRINPDEMKLSSAQQANGKLFLIYNQHYNGVPVFGTTSAFLVKNSKLSFSRVNYKTGISIDTSPKLGSAEAERIALSDFETSRSLLKSNSIAGGELGKQADGPMGASSMAPDFFANPNGILQFQPEIKSSELVVFPSGGKYSLAWKISASSPDADLLYFVDAHNGKIIDVRDSRIYFDVSGRVTGMVWPDPFPGSQQQEKNFSGALIEFPWPTNRYAYPDENGYYSFTGLEAPNGPITFNSRFTRQGITVYNARQAGTVHSASFSGDAIHDWNWAADDNSYKDEESNAYYHALRALKYAESLGVSTMESFVVNVNGYGSCNAYYSRPNSINFYPASSSCESTAVLSDVIYHEYGHGIIDELDPSLLDIGGYSGESGNLHEGLADYLACSLNDNPDMAEGFYKSNPSPLRRCNTSAKYPNNYALEPHSGAQIVSAAMWEVRSSLGQNYTDALLVDALRLQPITFSELAESLLAIDDDNANLSDGTPNAQAICDAFLNHGIGAPRCAGFTSKPLVEISSPWLDDYLRGGSLQGTVPIIGSAYPSRNSALVNYSLYLGGYSNLIGSSPVPVSGGSLLDWDTTASADGGTYLILNATDSSGQSSQISIGVKLDNIYMTSPLNYDVFRAGDTIALNGTLKQSSLSNYAIRYAQYLPGALNYSSAGISIPNGGTAEVENGTLAFWDTGAVAQKGLYLVEAVAYGDFEKHESLGKIYLDPALKQGWPVRLQDYYGPGCAGGTSCYWRSYFLEPVVADLDNDGIKETAVIQRGQPPKLFVFRPDGSAAWSAEIGQAMSQSVNPAIADVDGDGFREIIAYNSGSSFIYSEVYAYGRGGNLLSGWPVQVEYESRPAIIAADLDNDGRDEVVLQRHFSTGAVKLTVIRGGVAQSWNVSNGAYVTSGLMPFPAVGNFDSDPELEIVAVASRGNGVTIQTLVYVFNMDGSLVDGWPVYIGGTEGPQNLALSSPIVGDIDNDGSEDIVVGTFHNYAAPDVRTGGLYAFGRNGSLLPGWPALLGEPVRASPSLADRDNDGYLEVAVSTGKLNSTSPAKMYLLNHQGNALSGWPQDISDTSYYSTLQADLDDDGSPDALTTAGTGYFAFNRWTDAGLYAWKTTGEPVLGFPKNTEKETAAPAAIADLDSDGKLEIVASSDADYDLDSQKYKNRGTIYAWEANSPFVSFNSPWPSFQGNAGHSGRYSKPAAQILLLSPEQGRIELSPSISISYMLQSGSADAWLCTLLVNGAPVDVRQAIPNATYSYAGQYANGQYSWAVSCSLANSTLKSPSRSFTIAAQPLVALLSPENNSVFGAAETSLTYTASSAMNSALSCSLYVDGQLQQNVLLPSGSVGSHTANYSYGSHSWFVECTDATASAAAPARTFSVAAPPEISLLSPDDNSSSSSPSISLVYSASSEFSSVLDCRLYVNGQVRQSSQVQSGDWQSYQASYPNGNYSWNVECNDSLSAASSEQRSFRVAVPPTVSLLSPEANSILNSPQANLTYTASSAMNSGLSCSLYVDGQLQQSVFLESGATQSYSAAYQNGSHSWFVECADGDARAASAARNFTVPSAARVSLILPANNLVSSISSISLFYTASSASKTPMTCGVYLNNSLVQTRTTPSGSGYSYHAQFPNGSYSWYVNCTSAFGESAISEIRSFTVNVAQGGGGGGGRLPKPKHTQYA
ncbi:MAG: hypothetical protein QW568_03845 [Candidatus Anstonellaceae archaeon]